MPRGGARIGAGRPKKGEVRIKAPAGNPARSPLAPESVQPGIADAEPITQRSPLQYMLDVMNDPGADEKLRAQMAVAAAPYLHMKKGEGGKKDEQADKAKKAAGGRFKPAPPPLKLVSGR